MVSELDCCADSPDSNLPGNLLSDQQQKKALNPGVLLQVKVFSAKIITQFRKNIQYSIYSPAQEQAFSAGIITPRAGASI